VGLDAGFAAAEVVPVQFCQREVDAGHLAVAQEVLEFREREVSARVGLHLVLLARLDQVVEPLEGLEHAVHNFFVVVEQDLQPLEVDQVTLRIAFDLLFQSVRVRVVTLLVFDVLLRSVQALRALLFLVDLAGLDHALVPRVLKRRVLVERVAEGDEVVNPAPHCCDLLEVGADHLVVAEQPLVLAAVLEGHDAHALLLVAGPLSLLDRPVRVLEDAEPLLLAVDPLAHLAVERAVRQLRVDALPVRPVVQELPLLLLQRAVVLDQLPAALHHVRVERPGLLFAARPLVLARPVPLAVGEQALVHALVRLRQLALAVPLAVHPIPGLD